MQAVRPRALHAGKAGLSISLVPPMIRDAPVVRRESSKNTEHTAHRARPGRARTVKGQLSVPTARRAGTATDLVPRSATSASKASTPVALVVRSASAVRLVSTSMVLELMVVSNVRLADTPAAVARQNVPCAALAKQAPALHFHAKSVQQGHCVPKEQHCSWTANLVARPYLGG